MVKTINSNSWYVTDDDGKDVCAIATSSGDDGGTHAIAIHACDGFIINNVAGVPMNSVAIRIVPDLTIPRVGTRLMIGGKLVEVAKKPWRDKAGALWIEDAISGQNVRYE